MPDSGRVLRVAALRLLTRRDHSRAELKAKRYAFRGGSDTEVLLQLYADCGTEMVGKLRGMFAFGL